MDADPAIGDFLREHWEEGEEARSAREIARSVLDTDALSETRGLVRREVDGALDALGSHAEQSGGRHIADWAAQLCEAI